MNEEQAEPERRGRKPRAADIRIRLPQYPTAPASLAAATAFYAAAREEILERVRFRDQVVITVIAGIFIFVLNYGAFIFGAVESVKTVTVNEITAYCGNLLFITVLIWIATAFVTRYAAYQNSKIAELGYFISKVPALHLQEYGIRELEAKAVEVQGDAASYPRDFGPKTRATLKDSLGHWDRWARELEEDENIKGLREEFSQDRILEWLLICLSWLPTALLILFIFKFAIVISETDILFTATPLKLEINIVILAIIAGICDLVPWLTRAANKRGNQFKEFYKDARSGIPIR